MVVRYYDTPRERLSPSDRRMLEKENREHLLLKEAMKDYPVSVIASKDTNNTWHFRPNPQSIVALSEFFTQKPAARGLEINFNVLAEDTGRIIGSKTIPPIDARERTGRIPTSSNPGRDQDVFNWIGSAYTGDAVPMSPEPQLQLYRHLYTHGIMGGVFMSAINANTEREYRQGQRRNLTESELSRFILSTGIVDGKTERDIPAPTLEEITQVLKLDQDLGNPEAFKNDYFIIRDKMREKGYTTPAQDLVLGSLLQVHLFDKGRFIIFNNQGGFTVETEESAMSRLGTAEQDIQMAGDTAWTEMLQRMFPENLHQEPVALSRGLLANARNMRLQQLRKKTAGPNENILRLLSSDLDRQIPHDPDGSRSEEIKNSNLKTWEKTFLSLRYAIKNDVIKNADDDQRQYFDNAVAAGNRLGQREAVADFLEDPWNGMKRLSPWLATAGIIYMFLKILVKGDSGFWAGVRKFFGGVTVLSLIGLGYTAYKKTIGKDLKTQALGDPEEPEMTPSTFSKKVKRFNGWEAQWENGKTWTEILQTAPNELSRFAIGDLMVALHPDDTTYSNLKTSPSKLTQAKKFIQEFNRVHPTEGAHLRTMIEKIWESSKTIQGTAFQAQTEKEKPLGDIAHYVDDKEGFFRNAILVATGGLRERRMFATFITYRDRLQDVPIGDVLHIFNEDVPGATWTNPITDISNLRGKMDVGGIPKSANFTNNRTNILANPSISDEGRIHLRMLFNGIWKKRQNEGTNDATELVKDILQIPDSRL